MLNAKNAGGNTVAVFTGEMSLKSEFRNDIELHLQNVVDSGALFLHYLPEVDMRTGRILATEALVREVSRREVNCAYGRFTLHGFEDTTSGEIHLAMVHGTIDPDAETLVRVHEPISVLDFLDADNPRHSFSIDRAMKVITDAGNGVIVMLRRAESNADFLRTLA